MIHRLTTHVRGNAVGYLALFVALGGSSYAAVSLAPGSVRSAALAKHAVTHAKLANQSVTSTNIANRTITSQDLKVGAILKGLKGDAGATGAAGLAGIPGLQGPQGVAGPAGKDGSASIGAKVRLANSVTAPHGANTSVPLNSSSWTQSAGQLELIAGTINLTVPSTCTGSFGNSVVISVDGNAQTLAVAPTVPAGTSVTMPILVGTLSEPDATQQHTMTAAFANTCTKAGEDYAINGAKLDVINIG
jgi:hypothetical protein